MISFVYRIHLLSDILFRNGYFAIVVFFLLRVQNFDIFESLSLFFLTSIIVKFSVNINNDTFAISETAL